MIRELRELAKRSSCAFLVRLDVAKRCFDSRDSKHGDLLLLGRQDLADNLAPLEIAHCVVCEPNPSPPPFLAPEAGPAR